MAFIKNNKEKIIKLLIALALLYYFVLSHVMIVFKVVDDESEFYEITTKALTHNKSYVIFNSEICPDDIDYIDIVDEAMDEDVYSAGEFSEFKYTYKEKSDGTYRVKLKIYKPRLYKKIFAKARVKKIAKCYSKLGSDYEKVKAVHDYIILYNDYYVANGGAFNAICTGHSACTGYAYAFYEIMTEMGIPATIESGDMHMWNTVLVDGYWYNIDLTWDDTGSGVRYDYFLVCDADFEDHPYGDSDAEVSHPVTGRSAREYYRMVPNHKITRFILLIIIIGCGVAIIRYVVVIIPKKKKALKQQQEMLLEQTLRNNQEIMKLDEDMEVANNSEDENETKLEQKYTSDGKLKFEPKLKIEAKTELDTIPEFDRDKEFQDYY